MNERQKWYFSESEDGFIIIAVNLYFHGIANRAAI